MISEQMKAVIGCIYLESKTVLGLCVKAGVESHWFDGEARKLYDLALDRYVAGKDTDARIVINSATSDGIAFMNSCLESTATVFNAQYYIEELQKEVLKNDALILSDQVRLQVESGVDDIQGFVEQTARKWGDLIIHDESTMTDTEACHLLANKWEHPDRDKDRIYWPLNSFNDYIGTLDSEFVFVGAQPSVGKTAFMLKMADDLGNPDNKHPMTTSMLSLESPQNMIAPRRAARLGHVNTWRLKNQRANPGDFERFREASDKLKDFKTRIHCSGMNVDQIRAWGGREKDAGSKLLIIDNLRHVRISGRGMSEPERYAKACMAMKELRDDLGIAMIVLHHLNKDDQMAWSSDIKRDADIMFFIKENEARTIKATEANNWQPMDVIRIELEKSRDGGRYLQWDVEFVKQYQDFRDLAQTGDQ